MPVINIQDISNKTFELANFITDKQLQAHPELFERFGQAGRLRCFEDAVFHLEFLIEAMRMNYPEIFSRYIVWVSAMLKARDIPESEMILNLEYLQQAINHKFGEDAEKMILPFINSAKARLRNPNISFSSFIKEENPLKPELEQYMDYLLAGKRKEAKNHIHQLIKKGESIKILYEHIFQVAQYEIGYLWQCNKISVAHEHFFTAATQFIMSGLYQWVFSGSHKGKTLVASSVAGDLHEVGIRMVADIFEMEGWDTYYLGANMPNRQLKEALIEKNADILTLSVTLPTHVSKAAQLISEIKSDSRFKNIKILVGGYAFIQNPELWQNVGADGFAENASKALTLAEKLTGLDEF